MIRMLSETKFLGNDAVVKKLEDFGFEDSGDGFYDYFIPFTEYCACVDLDDMGAFIEDSQGNHMNLPFMRGQERVRLSGTVVGEFLDFIRDIEREADSVGGDISYMFESKKLRKSSNESNKTFTRRRSNRMTEAQSYDEEDRDSINKSISDFGLMVHAIHELTSDNQGSLKDNFDRIELYSDNLKDWEIETVQKHIDSIERNFDKALRLLNNITAESDELLNFLTAYGRGNRVL